MAENGLQKLIKGIFSHIKDKYGYTDEQALIYLQGYQDCAEENQKSLEMRDKMLRDTVAELAEAKQILKAAMSDLAEAEHCGLCKYEADDIASCQSKPANCFVWRYADEALKLIGDD